MARKRLIRKQPLWEKIKSYPFDLLLSINEQRLSMDWDDYVPQCLPFGTLGSLLFLILCRVRSHYIAANEKRNNSLFRTDYSTYQQVVSRAVKGGKAGPLVAPKVSNETMANTLLWTINLVLLLFLATSFINALNVYFYPYRNYTLLSRSTDSVKPKGSIVTKQKVSSGLRKGILSRLYAYFNGYSYSDTEGEFDSGTMGDRNALKKDVWGLSVWDPSLFRLYTAASFSPIVLLMVCLFSSSASFWKISVFIVLSNSCAVYLTSKFMSLIADKQIIYSETFNEYNKKYVIPKTSVLRKDAIVDATLGPFAPVRKIVHTDPVGHLQNEIAFVTHDINGSRHKTVRADFLDLVPSRSPSPLKHLGNNNDRLPYVSAHSSRFDTSAPQGINKKPDYYNTSDRHSQMMLSAPYARKNAKNDSISRANETFTGGNEPLSQSSSRASSPLKSPSRLGYNSNLSYNNRVQLSPNKSSEQSSPQRSPSPSKRKWH